MPQYAESQIVSSKLDKQNVRRVSTECVIRLPHPLVSIMPKHTGRFNIDSKATKCFTLSWMWCSCMDRCSRIIVCVYYARTFTVLSRCLFRRQNHHNKTRPPSSWLRRTVVFVPVTLTRREQHPTSKRQRKAHKTSHGPPNIDRQTYIHMIRKTDGGRQSWSNQGLTSYSPHTRWLQRQAFIDNQLHCYWWHEQQSNIKYAAKTQKEIQYDWP